MEWPICIIILKFLPPVFYLVFLQSYCNYPNSFHTALFWTNNVFTSMTLMSTWIHVKTSFHVGYKEVGIVAVMWKFNEKKTRNMKVNWWHKSESHKHQTVPSSLSLQRIQKWVVEAAPCRKSLPVHVTWQTWSVSSFGTQQKMSPVW